MTDIAQELKLLKLHGMAARYTELASQGLAGVQASEWLLKHLLEAETTDRHIRSIRYQIHAARFPVHRDLGGFDFEQSSVDQALIWRLATAEFTEAAHNIVLVGGTGTGKTHLATALGIKAIRPWQAGALLLHGGTGQPAGEGEGLRSPGPTCATPDAGGYGGSG